MVYQEHLHLACSKKHLPSFLESTEKLKEKNIRKVFCISINDPFVMEAWGRNYNLKDELTLLADVKGDFTKNIGAEFIWRGLGIKVKEIHNVVRSRSCKKIS